MNHYLEATPLLDYNHPTIEALVSNRKWETLTDFERISQIYLFVRDEIAFGYNRDDAISASEILSDGYGQCNTKGILLMTLLRRVGIENRMHGFSIDKKLQKGAITGLTYVLSPQSIIHSWVEIKYKDTWLNLEGFILDISYLEKLQNRFSKVDGEFIGYGVATDNFKNPEIDWNENNTYIQKEGINNDYGIFDSPDAFFEVHTQILSPLKKWIFVNIARKKMNKNVVRIRNK